jgi:RNA polymerase sigma-B factor
LPVNVFPGVPVLAFTGPPPLTDRQSLFDPARTRDLVERLPVDPSAREELIRLHLPLVQSLARRFRFEWEPLEDLVQVGTLGLLVALERFDPSRGVAFATFAKPTIIGELKHHRDRSWMVTVPRRLRQIGLELHARVPDLTQELGRTPAIGEIARSVGYSQEDVREAMHIVHAYAPASLDALLAFNVEPERVGVEEPGFELLELRWSVVLLLRQLTPRERQLVYLHFYLGDSQRRIAEKLGISQMHVSRLLDKALSRLRTIAAVARQSDDPEGPPLPATFGEGDGPPDGRPPHEFMKIS